MHSLHKKKPPGPFDVDLFFLALIFLRLSYLLGFCSEVNTMSFLPSSKVVSHFFTFHRKVSPLFALSTLSAAGLSATYLCGQNLDGLGKGRTDTGSDV